MTLKIKLLLFILVVLLFHLANYKAFAQTTPSFPSCDSPTGILKVEYNSGTHGIAGNTGQYKGSDKVYTLSDTTLAQCFCSENGEGIQTNWWKVSSLTEDELNILRRSGWDYIPNGALWGLENAPYMAKSSDYACEGRLGGISTSQGDVLGIADTGENLILFSMAAVTVFVFIIAFTLKKKQH